MVRRGVFIGASLAVHGAILVASFGWWPQTSEPAPVGAAPQPTLAGDTFDIATSQTPSLGGVSPTPTSTSTSKSPSLAASLRDAELGASPPTSTSTSTSTSKSPSLAASLRDAELGASPPTSTSGASTAGGVALTYGAVGDRSAVEVAVAFTRTFPQAASADLLWEQAPFGDAGSAELTFEIAEDGTLQSWAVTGGAPSAALRSAIDRTMALVNGRTFVGTTRLTRIRLTAQVSPDGVHDGLHGDVFAVGGSYAGGLGSAFFALSIGRRIDLTVKALP